MRCRQPEYEQQQQRQRMINVAREVFGVVWRFMWLRALKNTQCDRKTNMLLKGNHSVEWDSCTTPSRWLINKFLFCRKWVLSIFFTTHDHQKWKLEHDLNWTCWTRQTSRDLIKNGNVLTLKSNLWDIVIYFISMIQYWLSRESKSWKFCWLWL